MWGYAIKYGEMLALGALFCAGYKITEKAGKKVYSGLKGLFKDEAPAGT